MENLDKIVGYFEPGKTPTYEEFKNSWTSFFHKSEKFPQTQVVGLNDSLKHIDETKADKSQLSAFANGVLMQDAVDTYNDTSEGKTSLLATYHNLTENEKGWDVLVKNDETKGGKSNRYNWNGTKWVSVETGVYDEDVATKKQVNTETSITSLATTTKAKFAIPFSPYYYKNQSYIEGMRVSSVSVNIATSGLLTILIGKNIGDDENYIAEEIVFNVAVGVNRLPIDRVILKGESIGIGAITDTAQPYYDADKYDPITDGYYYKDKDSGKFKYSNSNYLGYAINIVPQDAIPAINEKISRINNDLNNLADKRIYTGSEGFDSNKNNQLLGWTNLLNEPIGSNGVIGDFKIRATKAGTLTIIVANIDLINNVFSIAKEYDIQVSEGLNELKELSIEVKRGQYVGLYGLSSSIYYQDRPSNKSFLDFNGKLTNYFGSITENRTMDYSFIVKSQTEIPESVLRNSRTTTNGCFLESTRDFATFDNNGFALSEGIMSTSTNGAKLVSKKRYGIDRRKQTYVFKATEANSKLVFASTPREGAINAGSAIRLDFGANKIQILQRYSGAIGNVIQEFTPNNTALEADIIYKLELINDGRTIRIRIAKGIGAASMFFSEFEDIGQRTDPILGYYLHPSQWGYTQGSMQGSSTIINESGSVVIYSFTHECMSSVSPFLYILGDSITEGFSVTDKEKYGNLLRDIFGETNVVISGIGGATTAGAKVRFFDELTSLTPYNVLIFLGSNAEPSAVYEANMREMIVKAQQNNANVILCTIPTQAGLSNIARALASEFSCKIVDFEKALKSNTVLIPDYYKNIDASGKAYNDNIHPNGLGHYVMFTEALTVL